VVVALIGATDPVHAQNAYDSPTNSGIRLGPVALSPVFKFTEFGLDSNPYNRTNDGNPVGDFTSRMTPAVDASLRSPHLRASGRSQFDFYQYKTLSDLNSVDSDNAGNVDFLINRLMLNFGGGYISTRHRQDLEIDAIAQRQIGTVTLGAVLRMTGKTSVTGSVQRSRLQYEPNSIYLNTDLAAVLNHNSSSESVGIRYAMTNLTTLSVEASQERARFDTAVDRNSEEFRITPIAEFSPFALVSGRAAIGYYKRTFHAVGLQPGSETSGTNVSLDLTYTLLGRTRFTVAASRRQEFSYLATLYNYGEVGINGSVTQRLGESWDVIGSLGRARLIYGQSAPAGVVATRTPDETVLTYAVNLGYNVGRIRIGGYVDHNQRDEDEPTRLRGYRRLRVGSSATYVF
jgi:hypothetical protein